MTGENARRNGARRRNSRIGGVVIATVLLLAFGTSLARANILAYENSETAAFLGEVQKMNCKLKGKGNSKRFLAGGKTINGAYELGITILGFGGFKQYTVPFGVQSPEVSFEGVSNPRDYDNAFPFPGGTPPPAGAGVIDFFQKGARVGLGIYSLPSRDYMQGVALSGNAKCVYPKS
jgi:hypothetical protein